MNRAKAFFVSFAKCFRIIEKRDLRKLALASFMNTLLSLLDLLAIGALGLLGSLTVSGIQSVQPSGIVGELLSKVGLSGFSFQDQVAIIGGFACLLLTTKTLLSAIVVFRISQFLANRSAKYSSKMITSLLSGSLSNLRRFTSQENLFVLSQGINHIVSGVVGAAIFLLAEMALTVLLLAGLFFVEPWLGLATLMYFGFIGIILFLILQRRIAQLARREAELNILGNEKIIEVISLFKELRVRNRQSHYIEVLSKSRFDIARNQAELGIIPNIAKYVTEIALVVGALAISATSFFLYDASTAVAILSIFLVTSSRIAPAILRMQTGIGSIRQNLASSKLTLDFIEGNSLLESSMADLPAEYRLIHHDFEPSIQVSELDFAFRDETKLFSINSIMVPAGSIVGVTGASGAGKTTFIDLLLGLLTPTKGLITISNLSPLQAIRRWPGAISYVPQETFLIRGTIIENICLGFAEDEIPQDQIMSCLNAADLTKLIDSLPNGIYSEVGERGNQLSGGQRQRIGIARALVTRPKLIVLDEATSALDMASQERVIEGMKKLIPDSTIIFISHDSQLISSCDQVIHFKDNGIVKLITNKIS